MNTYMYIPATVDVLELRKLGSVADNISIKISIQH